MSNAKPDIVVNTDNYRIKLISHPTEKAYIQPYEIACFIDNVRLRASGTRIDMLFFQINNTQQIPVTQNQLVPETYNKIWNGLTENSKPNFTVNDHNNAYTTLTNYNSIPSERNGSPGIEVSEICHNNRQNAWYNYSPSSAPSTSLSLEQRFFANLQKEEEESEKLITSGSKPIETIKLVECTTPSASHVEKYRANSQNTSSQNSSSRSNNKETDELTFLDVYKKRGSETKMSI